MFEETNLQSNSINQFRLRACLKQCRIAHFQSGGDILEKSCPCDSLSECRFVAQDGEDAYFTDKLQFYRQLASE